MRSKAYESARKADIWIAELTSAELVHVSELLSNGQRYPTMEDWGRAVLRQAIADGLVRSGHNDSAQ